MDEQWTKLKAQHMRSALIDEKQEIQNSHISPAAPNHMSHLRTTTCRILGLQPLIPFLQCFTWLGLRFVV